MSSIADRLREAREQAGYTTLEAGDLSGVPHCELRRIETGLTEPDRIDVRRLCVIYGCSIEWLLGQY